MFTLSSAGGNEPDRVVRTMKKHVELRNAAYSQCLQPGANPTPSPSPQPSPQPSPSPKPSPSPQPSPSPAPASGSWTRPILLPGQLPYTSATVTVRWWLLVGGSHSCGAMKGEPSAARRSLVEAQQWAAMLSCRAGPCAWFPLATPTARFKPTHWAPTCRAG